MFAFVNPRPARAIGIAGSVWIAQSVLAAGRAQWMFAAQAGTPDDVSPNGRAFILAVGLALGFSLGLALWRRYPASLAAGYAVAHVLILVASLHWTVSVVSLASPLLHVAGDPPGSIRTMLLLCADSTVRIGAFGWLIHTLKRPDVRAMMQSRRASNTSRTATGLSN